jgi:uncharacterized protein with PhoU and TrkA domain
MGKKLAVHPAAAIFPMMSPDELANLAADIKENGLINPIVVAKVKDDEGKDYEILVDGRNRRDACDMVGIVPEITMLDPKIDIRSFILSININRRHMTAAQRIMTHAMIFPAAEHGGSRKKGSSSATELASSSSGRLSMARTILRKNPDLAERVVAGTVKLDTAYNEVRDGEGKKSSEAGQLRELRLTRPDLAELVVEEKLDLDKGIAQAKSELAARNQQRWAATKSIVEVLQLFDRSAETADEIVREIDHAVAEKMGETITAERLLQAAAFLTAFAAALDKSLNPVLELEAA